MMVRFFIFLLGASIAALLFLYVLTGKSVYLNRAWQIIGLGLIFTVLIWGLMTLEYFS